MQFDIHDLSTAEILKQPEQFEATLNKILGKKHPKKQSINCGQTQ
jgi:hypothetical protein